MDKPFSKLGTIQTSSDLTSRTISRIVVARKRASIVNIIYFGFIEIVATTATIFSFTYVFSNLQSSGIFEYLSLIFTDSSASLAYSKELFLSVVEALPAVSIALALSACVALAWSTTRVIKLSKVITNYA